MAIGELTFSRGRLELLISGYLLPVLASASHCSTSGLLKAAATTCRLLPNEAG